MTERVTVHLVSALPPPNGGVNVWTENFMEIAPMHGIDVQLIRVGPQSEAEIMNPGARIRRAFTGIARPLAHLATASRTRRSLVHVCVSGGPSLWRGLALARIATLRGFRAVLHVHSRLGTCSPRALAALRRATSDGRIIAVTPSRQDHSSFSFVRCIQNMVAPSFGRGVRWHGPTEAPTLRLVFVGWMIREKGLFELAEAVARTLDVTVTLIGPEIKPADLAALRELIRRLGISDRFTCKGSVPHGDIARTMSAYDALVIPSHDESFGMVVIEAMHVGVPVLASRVGVLWDAPDDAFVELPIRDADKLARALASVVDRKAGLSRTAAAGLSYAESNFGADAIGQRWANLYAGLTR